MPTDLAISEFERKTFPVDAVQVTAKNMSQVADWCDGKVTRVGGNDCVKVRVHQPKNKRQTEAYVNDWVVYMGTGYKVYTPSAFANTFNPRSKKDEPVGSVISGD